MRPSKILLLVSPDRLVREIVGRVGQRLRAELIPFATNLESLMTQVDDLTAAVQALADKTAAVSEATATHRAAVDEAIALIQSLITGHNIDDPALDAAIVQLGDSAAALDQTTSDLAQETADLGAAGEAPPVDGDPVEG